VANKVPLLESLQISEKVTRSGRFFASQIRKRFNGLVGGEVEVHDQLDSYILPGSAQGTDRYAEELLRAKVYVGNADMYRRIMLGGTIGSAESYMEQQWSTDDLTLGEDQNGNPLLPTRVATQFTCQQSKKHLRAL